MLYTHAKTQSTNIAIVLWKRPGKWICSPHLPSVQHNYAFRRRTHHLKLSSQTSLWCKTHTGLSATLGKRRRQEQKKSTRLDEEHAWFSCPPTLLTTTILTTPVSLEVDGNQQLPGPPRCKAGPSSNRTLPSGLLTSLGCRKFLAGLPGPPETQVYLLQLPPKPKKENFQKNL